MKTIIMFFLVASVASGAIAGDSLRGHHHHARALLGSGSFPDLAAMGLPFKENAIMTILGSGNCDISKLLELMPVAQELGTKLGEIKSIADAEPLLNVYGNKALGALCANPNCPGEIISELDQSKLPAGITPAVLSAMSAKICTENIAQDGFCLVEAAEDALATVALASAGNPVTAVAGGAAKVCSSGCYAALSKDFLVEMKGLLETLVGQTFDAGYADVATMCDASTGGGGGSTGTGGNTDDKDEGADKDEAGKNGDDDKKETAKGIKTEQSILEDTLKMFAKKKKPK